MAAPLPTLRRKLRDREAARKRQRKLAKHTGKAGHRRAVRRHTKAIKKLKRLIRRFRIDWNGHRPVGGKNLRRVVRYALGNFDVYVTSTNGGVHSPTSYHYRNQAVDIGSDSAAEKARCHAGIYRRFGAGAFAELFGPHNHLFVKNGSTYTAAEGDANESLHDDHVHIAITN